MKDKSYLNLKIDPVDDVLLINKAQAKSVGRLKKLEGNQRYGMASAQLHSSSALRNQSNDDL